LAYSLSTGKHASTDHFFQLLLRESATYRRLSTPRIKVNSQIKLILSRCDCRGTERVNLQLGGSDPDRVSFRERGCGWRLMTPATTPTLESTVWILGSLWTDWNPLTNPAEEALRQGRNPDETKKCQRLKGPGRHA
jgi:hypothetical protein